MSNPTSNFGWVMPSPTDLVTDLPADFEVFGQAVDTSMADLKGGTTGQILSKNTNADMDFVWINNDQGDITGVTAGTGLTGGGTSGAVTVSFDVANYGGGEYAAGKNRIINGDFGIWQRGTTFAAAANNSYTADRWQVQTSGSGVTVSQQTFTLGSAPVAGYEGTYFLRMTNDGTSATCRIGQPIEDVRIFAGQTVTISFWAKSTISDVFTTSYILQSFGSGGSAQVATSLGTMPTVTSSWARYSITVAVPSIAGKTIGAGSSIAFQLRLKASAAYDFDLWGFQVEAGSVATPFTTATGNKQGELAACQRYYFRFTPTAAGDRFGNGLCDSTTAANLIVNFPVQMRTSPTALEQSGNTADYQVRISGATSITVSTVPTFAATSTYSAMVTLTVASGLTAGQAMNGRAVQTTGYLGWSAEL